MTPEQLAVLKADIIANPDSNIQAWRSAYDAGPIADWYNSVTSPAFIVWKSSVRVEDVLAATSFSGTGGFISRSAGERDAYLAITARDSINPAIANIRQAFADIFSGAGQGATDTKTAFLTLSKRTANRLERLFATGTGSDAVPATMTYEGEVSFGDVLSLIIDYPT